MLVALIVPSIFTLIDLFQSLEPAPTPVATSSPIAPLSTLIVKLPPPWFVVLMRVFSPAALSKSPSVTSIYTSPSEST